MKQNKSSSSDNGMLMLWVRHSTVTQKTNNNNKKPCREDPGLICWGSHTAITKKPVVIGLNKSNLFSCNSGGYKSEIKMLGRLFPSEDLEGRVHSRCLFLPISSLCLHIIFPLYVFVFKFPLLVRAPVILGYNLP